MTALRDRVNSAAAAAGRRVLHHGSDTRLYHLTGGREGWHSLSAVAAELGLPVKRQTTYALGAFAGRIYGVPRELNRALRAAVSASGADWARLVCITRAGFMEFMTVEALIGGAVLRAVIVVGDTTAPVWCVPGAEWSPFTRRVTSGGVVYYERR